MVLHRTLKDVGRHWPGEIQILKLLSSFFQMWRVAANILNEQQQTADIE
jgi:hypothetical protein